MLAISPCWIKTVNWPPDPLVNVTDGALVYPVPGFVTLTAVISPNPLISAVAVASPSILTVGGTL